MSLNWKQEIIRWPYRAVTHSEIRTLSISAPPTNVAWVRVPPPAPYVSWVCCLFSTPVLCYPQRPTLSNSSSIWNARTRLNEFLRTPKCSVNKQVTVSNYSYNKDSSKNVTKEKKEQPVTQARPGSVMIPYYDSYKITVFVWGKVTILKLVAKTEWTSIKLTVQVVAVLNCYKKFRNMLILSLHTTSSFFRIYKFTFF